MSHELTGTLSRSTISINAIKQLRFDIIMRCYPQGWKLTEQQICENYGISRSPARAIMLQLEKEGMLRMLSNGCKEIIPFTKNDLTSLYELRNYLELSAVQSVCRAKKRSYAPLVKAIEEIEESNSQNEKDYLQMDIDFHRAVIAMSDNRFLVSVYDNLSPILYTVFSISVLLYEQEFQKDFTARHHKLVESLIVENEENCIRNFQNHHAFAMEKAVLVMDEIESGKIGGLKYS